MRDKVARSQMAGLLARIKDILSIPDLPIQTRQTLMMSWAGLGLYRGEKFTKAVIWFNKTLDKFEAKHGAGQSC